MVFANNGDRRGERAYEEQWEKQREGERGPLNNITELLAKILAPNTTVQRSRMQSWLESFRGRLHRHVRLSFGRFCLISG